MSPLCQHVDFDSKVDKVVSQNHTTPLRKDFFLNFILCVLTTCCFCVEDFSLAPGASWYFVNLCNYDFLWIYSEDTGYRQFEDNLLHL